MGILNDVYLIVNGDIGLRNTQVISDFDTDNPQEAYLTVYTTLKNYSDADAECEIKGEIQGITFGKKVKIGKNERWEVVLSYEEISELVIKNPRLWWIHTLGNPELETCQEFCV